MLSRRLSPLVVALALLVASFASVASAQDGTPAAGTPTAGGALLADLGYPEVVIEATDAGIADPGELAAGLTLITFDNQSGADAALELYPTGDQAGYDALIEAFNAPAEMGPPPAFYEITISGGVAAPAGGSAGVVVDLTAGTWAFNYYVAEENGPGVNIPIALEVTGEGTAATLPEADVVAEMYEMDFTMPTEIPAGPMIWEVDNTGDQPHFILLSRYPEAFTEDDVMQLLMAFDPAATPDPAATTLDFALFEDAFESPTLSAGQTNWYEIDLEPGYYVALCFIPDVETGAPHALMGMYEIFEVV